MKKLLSIVLSVAMLMSVTAGIDFTALAVPIEGYDYIIDDNDDNTVIITNYEENETDVKIPAKLGKYTVIGIDTYAFKDKEMESVTIPEGIKSIADNAFTGCINLKSFNVPASVTEISGNPLTNCTSLEKITVDSGNKFFDSRNNCNAIIRKDDDEDNDQEGDELVSGCKNTKKIPDGITSIDYEAFSGCTGLKSIDIPEGVTSFESCAFAGCTGLESINIPESVKVLGGYVFQNCTGLTSVKIPKNVEYIGDGIFNCYDDDEEEYTGNLKEVYLYNDQLHDFEDEEDENFSISNLVDSMPAGSTLHAYMANNAVDLCYNKGINFIPLDENRCSQGIHAYCIIEVIKEPTCTEEGLEKRSCYYCGESINKAIDATGHDYNRDGFCNKCNEKDPDFHPSLNSAVKTGNQSLKLKDSSSTYFASFTAPANGTYTFTTSGNNDTCGTLYDSNFNMLDYNDDGAEDEDDEYSNLNFKITYELEKGKTYIIGCRFYDDENTDNNNTIVLNISVGEHTHSYTARVTKPATCTAEGVMTYSCVCGVSYTRPIAKIAHKPVKVNAIAPTFTSEGKTAGTVCAVCRKVLSGETTVAKLGLPALKKAKKGNKSFTATWKKVAGVDGYQIQYSLKKNMKKSSKKTVKGDAKTKLTVKKLKKGKKYYVRIRAYKNVNGKKVYSKWSAKKTVKVK